MLLPYPLAETNAPRRSCATLIGTPSSCRTVECQWRSNYVRSKERPACWSEVAARSPLDSRQGGWLESELVLSFHASFFWEIGDCALLCIKAQVERVLEQQGLIARRSAQNHRAARNQAKWLTEVGRPHQTQGRIAENSPIYSQAVPKGKRQRLFSEHRGPVPAYPA